MTEITQKHYDVFETKELARERIKSEEEARARQEARNDQRDEKLLKIHESLKIYRNPSFSASIGLNHLVSKNTSLSGHFGTFTTHITRFFT